jgi:phosphoribosyl 1,2-cyclic phosphodiesterase
LIYRAAAMKARIWGCRGSLATPGPETVRYGGDTSCVEVRTSSGRLVVLDAGTGIRQLGISLGGSVKELDLLLTHMHLDHIEGLGFFAPLFDPECTIRVWGPRPLEGSLEELIATYLSPPYFPVPFERIPATISFTELAAESFEIDEVVVTTTPVCHPGSTLGYRLSLNGSSFAYIPDNEPALDRESGLAVAGDADVLFHDAQFTDEEYSSRVGWGHSAMTDFVTYLAAAAPKRAVMFHHDPTHADGQLETMLAGVQTATSSEAVELAHEGLEVELA